jgi:hypothetical protein
MEFLYQRLHDLLAFDDLAHVLCMYYACVKNRTPKHHVFNNSNLNSFAVLIFLC